MRKAKERWNFWKGRWRLEGNKARPCDWNRRLGHGATGGDVARTRLSRDGIGFWGLSARVNAVGQSRNLLLPYVRCGSPPSRARPGGDWKCHCAGKSGAGRGIGPAHSLSLVAGDARRRVSAREAFDCNERNARENHYHGNAGVDFSNGREATELFGGWSGGEFWEKLRARWRRGVYSRR